MLMRGPRSRGIKGTATFTGCGSWSRARWVWNHRVMMPSGAAVSQGISFRLIRGSRGTGGVFSAAQREVEGGHEAPEWHRTRKKEITAGWERRDVDPLLPRLWWLSSKRKSLDAGHSLGGDPWNPTVAPIVLKCFRGDNAFANKRYTEGINQKTWKIINSNLKVAGAALHHNQSWVCAALRLIIVHPHPVCDQRHTNNFSE